MEQDVKALRQELALLKLQFSERVREVEERIDLMLTQASDEVSEPDNDLLVNKPSDEHTETAYLNSPKTENNVQKTSSCAPSHSTQPTAHKLPKSSTENLTSQNARTTIAKPHEPNVIDVFIAKVFSALLSTLFDWFSPVTKIYQSYKERGMLGIFALTTVGIVLTLAGFGYLMQLVIDQLGAGAKSLLMTGAASSVIGIGVLLKFKSKFSEFATAIVGLGLLLCYSTVYFAGSVYGIIPSTAILLLYLIIAFSCHGFSLWLDTKILAGLGIIGIATMPMLSSFVLADTTLAGYSSVNPIYYLLSLMFVNISALILAFKRLGMWLVNLSLVFSLIGLEWVIQSHPQKVSGVLIDLFYLLFFSFVAYVSFLHQTDKYATSDDSSVINHVKYDNKSLLVLLAAAVGATLMLFFQVADIVGTELSTVFIINTVVTAVTAVLFYKARHTFFPLLVLVSITWAILAVVVAIGHAYWGIAWAIEGLLLLYLGQKYVLPKQNKSITLNAFGYQFTVINQAQLLVAGALVYSWGALAPYFPLPALHNFDGWMLTIVIVGVIALWQRMINKTNSGFDSISLVYIKPALQFAEAAWLAIIVIACADIWLGNYTGALVIFVQAALFFRAKQCKLQALELLGVSLILAPLYYAYIGAMDIGTFRFTSLPGYAQLAVVSAFVQLWLWSAYYRRYQPDSTFANLAEHVRIFFYLLLPICWLGSVIRRFDENALLVLWLSPLMALALAAKIKHKLLTLEFKWLVSLASIGLFIGVAELSLMNSLVSLTGFILLYAACYWLDKKHVSPEFTQFGCSVGLFSIGIALTIFIAEQTHSAMIPSLFAALYWSICFNQRDNSHHLARNETAIIIANLVIVVWGWAMALFEPQFAIIPCIFIITCLIHRVRVFDESLLANRFAPNADLLLHTLGSLTYISLLVGLSDLRFDLLIAPALAIHGALILFLKDKRPVTVKYGFLLILVGIIKLGLFDAANAVLWQKVMLFMGIGLFILVASFSYQKMLAKVEGNEV